MSIALGRLRTFTQRLEFLDWILWFGCGSWALQDFLRNDNPVAGFLAVLLLAPGCFQLAAHRWTWAVGLGAWLGLGAFFVTITIFRDFSAFRLFGLGCVFYGIYNHIIERPRFTARTSAPSADAGGPDRSLVLWLREPLFLDEARLGQIAARAYDRPFNEGDDHPCFVVGKDNHYLMRVDESCLLIHHWARPYFDDPEAAATDLRELRRAEAVRRHQAWLAVDIMSADDDIGDVAAHALIGRFLAEIDATGADILAVYHPATGRIAPWAPALRETLAGPAPLSVFEEPIHVPVVQVADDSPALAAAVAEARRRWPEFLAAFHASPDKSRFSVKAPVTEAGNTEFIWIEAKAVSDGRIHGLLANDPVALGDLKLGDFVSVPEAELNDWICPDPVHPDRPLGLFTVQAIQAAKHG